MSHSIFGIYLYFLSMCSLSQMQIELGILYFYLMNLATQAQGRVCPSQDQLFQSPGGAQLPKPLSPRRMKELRCPRLLSAVTSHLPRPPGAQPSLGNR